MMSTKTARPLRQLAVKPKPAQWRELTLEDVQALRVSHRRNLR